MAKKGTVKDASVVEEKKQKKFEDVDAEKAETEIFVQLDQTKKVKKGDKVEKVDKSKKEGFFAGVKKEMKKVVWPKFVDVVKYTIAVILFCLFLTLLFWAVTSLVAAVKRMVG